jgi:hypothetical protein
MADDYTRAGKRGNVSLLAWRFFTVKPAGRDVADTPRCAPVTAGRLPHLACFLSINKAPETRNAASGFDQKRSRKNRFYWIYENNVIQIMIGACNFPAQ